MPNPNIKWPFVVIEGIDGVGKTTTAQLVAHKLAGVSYKTPSGPFAEIRTAIDRQANPTSRFYFYLSAVVAASTEIAELLSECAVVCDRYIFSTYAYHFAMDGRLRGCATPLPILWPDLAILLVANESNRVERLTQRELLLQQRITGEHDTAFLRRVEAEFRSMPLVVVDTTDRPQEVVANQVVSMLTNHLPAVRAAATEVSNEHVSA